MRELQPHSLHRLVVRVCLGPALLALALCAHGLKLQAALPESIGAISDYGNVLNHSGRLELAQRAEAVGSSLGMDVYILSTWESPTPRVEDLALGIMEAWGIAGDSSLLVVFLRDDLGDWTASVQVGSELQRYSPNLRQGVSAAIETLVSNDRIQEAMIAVFDVVDGGYGAETDAPIRAGSSRVLRLVTVCLALAAAAWVAWRRVCPRCGRFLRKDVSRDPLRHGRTGWGARSSTIYLCPKCGYQRSGERARRSRRGPRPL